MSAPAALAAIPLLAGVVTGALTRPSVPFLSVVLALGWLCTATCLARKWTRAFVAACVCGHLAAGAILGTWADRAATEPPILDWFKASGAQGLVRVTGVLREDAAPTPFAVTATVDAIAIEERGRELPTHGGLRAAISGSLAKPLASTWRQGRTIVIDALLREPVDYRNIGVPGDRERLARQGIALFAGVKSGALVSVVSRGSPAAEAAAALRAYVRAATGDAVGRWSAKSAGVVTAILIGDRSGLDPDDERRLQEAGTYHVIAISGGNIALLTTLLVGVGRAARLSPRRTAGLAIVLLAFYGYAAGLAPSVMRATLAGLIYLSARLIDHRGTPTNALGVAGALAAATTPLSVLDPGFVLSFGATLAIVVAATRLAGDRHRDRDAGFVRSRMHSIWFAARALLAATLCAEIALAPVGARLFGRVSLAGLLLNFVAIPVMSAIQIAGVAAVALHAVSASAAAASGWIAHLGTVVLLRSASLVDEAPWLVLDVPAPSLWVVALWYLAWGVLIVNRRKRAQRFVGSLTVAAAAALMLWGPPVARAGTVASPPPGWTRVAFIDVGQGDATLIIPAGGTPLLVDAGGTPGSSFDLGRRVTVPALWSLGISKLGALILTHGDPDHIGGAPAVLRTFRPREVWEGISVPASAPLQQLHKAATRRDIRWRTVRKGESLAWGDARIRVLHPPEPDWERQKVRNDDSIVLEVRIGRVVFVLPGDIGQAVEETLPLEINQGTDEADFTVVKAPHHGSAGSSSARFIAATHPSVVIFSAGRRNPFGHPSSTVLDRYRAAGARIFRTDEDGEVIVDTNGRDVRILTWRSLDS